MSLQQTVRGIPYHQDIQIDKAGRLHAAIIPFFERIHRLRLVPLWIQMPTHRYSGAIVFHCDVGPTPEALILRLTILDPTGDWHLDFRDISSEDLKLPVVIGGSDTTCPSDYLASIRIPLFRVPKRVDLLDLIMSYTIAAQDSEIHSITFHFQKDESTGFGPLME